MTSQTPIIDLAAATAPGAPAELLDAVKEASETVGVIQVINHGVPEHLISEFDQRIGRLLALRKDRKAELASPAGHPYRGWRQWPDDFGRLELERFSLGQFGNVEHARKAGLAEEFTGPHSHHNVWPGDDRHLRDLTFRYISAGESVAERVLDLYARAQGLPTGTFPLSPLPCLSFTVNNYPVWTYPDTGNDEEKLLLLEHANRSAVTVLARGGGYEGLQVQLPDGHWLPVPVVPGALQVFSGTLLTRWTNGLLRPARHRRIADGSATRRPVAIFYYPGLEQAIAPLAPFVVPDEETDYSRSHNGSRSGTAWRTTSRYSAARVDHPRGTRANHTSPTSLRTRPVA